MILLAGSAQPLGPSLAQGAPAAVNFAVFSQHASGVTLELYSSGGSSLQSIALDPTEHRSGDVWHIAVEGLPRSGILYGYRVSGEGGWETGHRWDPTRVMLDPYAPLVAGRRRFAVRDEIEQFKQKVSIE